MISDITLTPNPRVRQFRNSGPITEVPLDFVTASANDDFISDLFDLFEVERVYVAQDYVSVTVSNYEDWEQVEEKITTILNQSLEAFDFRVYDNAKLVEASKGSDLVEKIKGVLDQYVRPAVAHDGGDIAFKAFNENDGTLIVTMHGACSGCPSSTATLKLGVENLMRHMVPEVSQIVTEDDL